jgi:hypothetical protein
MLVGRTLRTVTRGGLVASKTFEGKHVGTAWGTRSMSGWVHDCGCLTFNHEI